MYSYHKITFLTHLFIFITVVVANHKLYRLLLKSEGFKRYIYNIIFNMNTIKYLI